MGGQSWLSMLSTRKKAEALMRKINESHSSKFFTLNICKLSQELVFFVGGRPSLLLLSSNALIPVCSHQTTPQ